ncbi:hypothetical protein BTUL_0168g00020 [Botrytis tulipae]|uniref:Uncharacterized protein n=1 Tax=Botrytis tulipae TaxID=87230 RepID=A0A4Z1EAS3_9HELO|nr:hypothetical protein BTUL_0168g00020 [Botrytis tulipae]
MCILKFFQCGACAEANGLSYSAWFCPSNEKTRTPLYKLSDDHKLLHIEVLHRAARCYKTIVPPIDYPPDLWPKDWTTCPSWIGGHEKILLKQTANESIKIQKAFDKAFEYDYDNCWIKEKVWKREMSVAEVMNQIKMAVTGKKIKRRFKVEIQLEWTKPWINGTSLAEQERNTPKYDIVQEVYEQKHLAVLDEDVIESLCEILKELAEKGFRVDPSLISYGDSTEKDDKE